MRKKLVMSMMMIVTMAAFLTGSALAALVDTESSSDNSFQAGTLDLKTDYTDGVTQTLDADWETIMKPGSKLGPATIVLKNIGSVDGTTLDIDVSYTTSDSDPNPGLDMSNDAVAAMLQITQLELGGESILGDITNSNSNTYKDIQDLMNADFSDDDGISPGQTKNFVIEVTLSDDLKSDSERNEYRGDGIDMNFTFTLNQ